MNIKTKIQIAILFLLIAAGGMLFMLLATQRQLNNQHTLNLETQKALTDLFDLGILVSEYTINPQERIFDQWENVNRSLRKQLDLIEELSDHKAARMVEESQEAITSINRLFYQLVTLQADSVSDYIRKTKIKYLNSQIGTYLQLTIRNGNKLISLYYSDMRELQRQVIQLVFYMLVSLLLLLVVSLGFIILRIFRPLESMAGVMEQVGTGNLELQINLKGKDEISILGIAFDRMIRDLQEVTMDKAELAKVLEMREQALKESKQANDQLEQFAYIAAHDLQEPLRMVSSYTQLLAKRYGDVVDKDGQEFIAFAVDGAMRMQRLIQDLLTYSRVTKSEEVKDLVDASSILGEAISRCKEDIDRENAVVMNDELPSITVDRQMMVKVFENLIENAIKFKGNNPPRVYITARQEGGFWVFAFKDNGKGIEKQYHQKIFKMFQRLQGRKTATGTGVGLALCKRILEQHGGDIWARI